MKKKNIQWLYDELPKLVGEGVLSAEAATGLREYYGAVDRRTRLSLALIVCSILGALLIGLGMILLFAHNWQNLSRPVRTAVSFAPLILGQALTGWTIMRRGQSVAWREGASVFLMAGIGITIALISQTYHLSSDMAKFLLVWMLLSLPLVYLIRANLPAALYCAGITAWVHCAQPEGGQTIFFWPLLTLVVPHFLDVLRENRYGLGAVFLCWIVPSCLCLALPVFLLPSSPMLWVVVYPSLFAAFYLTDQRWFDDAPSLWQRPFLVIGTTGIALISLILTFHQVWEEIRWVDFRWIWERHGWKALQAYGLAVTLLIAVGGLLVDMVRRKRYETLPFGLAAVLSAGVYLLTASGGPGTAPLYLFNLYLLALGVLTLRRGLRKGRLGTVNGGLLLLSMLIIARFFDADLTFTLRGIMFILIGTAFLMTNMVMKRRGTAS